MVINAGHTSAAEAAATRAKRAWLISRAWARARCYSAQLLSESACKASKRGEPHYNTTCMAGASTCRH
jgi:hypothetical protein